MPEAELKFAVRANAQKVWEFLSDMKKIASCLPGLQQVEALEEGKYLWKMKLNVGFVSRNIELITYSTDIKTPYYAAWTGEGDEISMIGSVHIRAISKEETKVTYRATANARGVLEALLNQIIRMRLRDENQKFAECVKSKLERI